MNRLQTATGRQGRSRMMLSRIQAPVWAIISAMMMLLWTPARQAHAHDARPLSIEILEQSRHVYHVQMRVPPSVDSYNQPEIIWPEGCRSLSQTAVVESEASRSIGIVRCSEGIEGRRLQFRYASFNPSLSTLIRATLMEGSPRIAVIPPEQTEWVVPAAPSWAAVARDYLLLGIKHIWLGIDHLLFVAGLLIIARTPKRVLMVITGFTIAHSITLSLSALRYINAPVIPTEAAIALSIIFLAREIARGRADSLAYRFPLIVSSSFGLLHGLGFAAALREIGLPEGEIPAALFFFNLGVELGQIAFILPVLGLIQTGKRLIAKEQRSPMQHALAAIRMAAPYAIGIPAAFWFLERVAKF